MDILSSWDNVVRLLIFLVIGVVLLIVNIWYLRALREEISGGEVVIAPFQIIGQKDEDGRLGNNLAYILQARLTRIEQDLAAAQESLKNVPRASVSEITSPLAQVAPPSAQTSAIPIFHPSILPIGMSSVHIPTELLQTTNIKLAVGGVDVGGVLPWVQQRIVRPRTLNFSVIYEGETAIIDGNIAAFGKGKGNSTLHIETKASTADITSNIAYALIQRKLSEEGNATVEALSLDDFRGLLNIILSTSELNRKGTFGSPPTKDDFAKLLPDAEGLAKKVPQWTELSYLAASISESAGNNEKAITFYEQIQLYGDNSKPGPHNVYSSIKDEVEKRLQALRPEVASVDLSERQGDAGTIIRADAEYANNLLNKWLGRKLDTPPVQLLEPSSTMSYWDGKQLNLPPQAQYLPDLTYHETSQGFINRVKEFFYQGESGAIQQSYANIMASLVKQERTGKKGQQADWVLVPGGVAWVKGEDVRTTKDQTPLFSLKEPGTAYNDPTIGKDSQVSNYKNLYKGEQDAGGVHINVGIPNKAFYETAIRIGSDRARDIWLKALPKLNKTAKISSLAEQTYQMADTDEERIALKEAWNAVGISIGT
jgi:hypothetical protein